MKWLVFAGILVLPLAALLACHLPRAENAAPLPRLITSDTPRQPLAGMHLAAPPKVAEK
jgi:hypothetical protein